MLPVYILELFHLQINWTPLQYVVIGFILSSSFYLLCLIMLHQLPFGYGICFLTGIWWKHFFINTLLKYNLHIIKFIYQFAFILIPSIFKLEEKREIPGWQRNWYYSMWGIVEGTRHVYPKEEKTWLVGACQLSSNMEKYEFILQGSRDLTKAQWG